MGRESDQKVPPSHWATRDRTLRALKAPLSGLLSGLGKMVKPTSGALTQRPREGMRNASEGDFMDEE
jgi:hypothetical protein